MPSRARSRYECTVSTVPAPGLPGNWLNGWLAAIGTTSLVADLRVSWSDDPVPTAVLHAPADTDILSALADRLPDIGTLGGLAIARTRPGSSELSRKAGQPQFLERAALVRAGEVAEGDRSLEATMSDLYNLQEQPEVPHAPFDPPVPKGLTLFERVVSCRQALDDLVGPGQGLSRLIAESLGGRGRRIQANGLGFDYRRSATSVHGDARVYIDPIVEMLAFFGLQLFPFRGPGRSVRELRQRGFAAPFSRKHAFRWPCWLEPLDWFAVDALLDRVHQSLPPLATSDPTDRRRPRSPTRDLRRLGVIAVYGSVFQQPRGSADTYRAYAAERVW